MQSRDIMNIKDIKDSWPRKPYIRKSKYEYIDYNDVTNTEFKTSRNTNPLDHFYTLKYIDGTKKNLDRLKNQNRILDINICLKFLLI